jgi:hypothetical protein
MAADMRADISVAIPARKILCKSKRHYHAQVWTAIARQLERMYVHYPEAERIRHLHGISVSERSAQGRYLRRGMQSPKTAGEMEAPLRLLLPDDMPSA